jgi:hypothetical protein
VSKLSFTGSTEVGKLIMRAASDRIVVDHYRLAQAIRNALADQAPDDVSVAPSSKWHDQSDRPVGILCKGYAWQQH